MVARVGGVRCGCISAKCMDLWAEAGAARSKERGRGSVTPRVPLTRIKTILGSSCGGQSPCPPPHRAPSLPFPAPVRGLGTASPTYAANHPRRKARRGAPPPCGACARQTAQRPSQSHGGRPPAARSCAAQLPPASSAAAAASQPFSATPLCSRRVAAAAPPSMWPKACHANLHRHSPHAATNSQPRLRAAPAAAPAVQLPSAAPTTGRWQRCFTLLKWPPWT